MTWKGWARQYYEVSGAKRQGGECRAAVWPDPSQTYLRHVGNVCGVHEDINEKAPLLLGLKDVVLGVEQHLRQQVLLVHVAKLFDVSHHFEVPCHVRR